MSDETIPKWERRAARNAKRIEELKRKRDALKKPKRGRSQLQFVYFIRSQDFVKIGWTGSMELRVSNAQVDNPHAIELLAVMSGGPFEEAELHSCFRSAHHRGEWFRLTDEILSLVDEIVLLDPIDARVRAGEWFVRKMGSRNMLMFPRNIEALRKREVAAANMVGSITVVLPTDGTKTTTYCNIDEYLG